MKREIVLPDDLAALVEAYRRDQPEPPPLSAVAEAALRRYLAERGFSGDDEAEHSFRPLVITPAPKGSGESDVSIDHDRHLAEM